SGSDWRKIERLVQVAVEDKDDNKARKLNQTLRSISVQNELLKHENQGLREALIHREKHLKHGKPLDLQQRQEYHDGAVVRSTRKVREARARKTVKEHKEKELQLQKSERAKLKKESQLYKLKIAQEKRVARAEAKVVKEKEKAEQAANRTQKQKAQKAAKLLQQRQKIAQKGKKETLKLPRAATKKKKQVVNVEGSGEASGAASAAPLKATRYGRNIKLPEKYK
ncbi:hypothetical protein GQ43DRAFT_374452, partial [Delitschia confertaspora ATCC 74209]